MVLNPDGTPNPLPIIDVYGTRRGPKIKRQDPTSTANALLDMGSTTLSPVTPKEKSKKVSRRQSKGNNDLPSDGRLNKTSHTPPISPQQFTTPPNQAQIKHEAFSSSSPVMNHQHQQHMSPKRMPLMMDEKPFILEKEMSANLLMQQQQQFSRGHLPMAMTPSMSPATLQQLLMQNLPQNGGGSSISTGVNPMAALQNLLMQNSVSNFQPGLESFLVGKSQMELYVALNQYMVMQQQQANNSPVANFSSPMDFTKLVEEQRSRLMSQLIQRQQSPPVVVELPRLSRSPQLQKQQQQRLSPTLVDSHALDLRNPKRPHDIHSSESVHLGDSKKRKRKGKAQRYNRNKDEYDEHDQEHDFANGAAADQVLDFSNNNYTTTNNNDVNAVLDTKVQNNQKAQMGAENCICKYCDIAFPPVLYALHMRFHSSDVDPFRCNVCGTKSSDKVSFFVHLATASH